MKTSRFSFLAHAIFLTGCVQTICAIALKRQIVWEKRWCYTEFNKLFRRVPNKIAKLGKNLPSATGPQLTLRKTRCCIVVVIVYTHRIKVAPHPTSIDI